MCCAVLCPLCLSHAQFFSVGFFFSNKVDIVLPALPLSRLSFHPFPFFLIWWLWLVLGLGESRGVSWNPEHRDSTRLPRFIINVICIRASVWTSGPPKIFCGKSKCLFYFLAAFNSPENDNSYTKKIGFLGHHSSELWRVKVSTATRPPTVETSNLHNSVEISRRVLKFCQCRKQDMLCLTM